MQILTLKYEQAKSSRIDQYLASSLSDLSRSYIQKLIKDGQVLINNAIATKPSDKINFNDQITVTIPDTKKDILRAVDLNLSVIYEDKNIIIINKPSGLVVHPGAGTKGQDTLVNGIMYVSKDLSGISGEERPGIVHRLDKETSGLIMVCKNDLAHRFYSDKFKNREMNKTYMALTYNVPHKASWSINSSIGRHKTNRIKMAGPGGLNPRDALTNFKLIESFKLFSLIEAKPKTGRTHQIRVHLSENNLPILGDPIYENKNTSNEVWKKANAKKELSHCLAIQKLITRLMLHAFQLEYEDQDGIARKFEAPLPAEFTKIMEALRK